MKRFLCLFLVVLILAFSLSSCANGYIEVFSSGEGKSLVHLDIGRSDFLNMQPGEKIEGRLLIYELGELRYTAPAYICCFSYPTQPNMDKYTNEDGNSFQIVSSGGFLQANYRYNFQEECWEPQYSQ